MTTHDTPPPTTRTTPTKAPPPQPAAPPAAARQHTMVPPWMRYTPKTPFSQPTRDHHGTQQGDTAEDPPTVRPRHPLPAGSLPRAHPTPEQIAPPPPWKRYTPATHRHSAPAGAAPGPQHAQDAATHRPADPANAIACAWPIHGAPRTTGPTQQWADTPKHHTTTPPWLRHSSPTHPAPGDLRPHATPTPHGPRTETRQEDDHKTARGCPTPPEDQPRATTHPTRSGHGAHPPHREGHHTTQHHHTTPDHPPQPGDMGHHSPPTQERSRATPTLHPTPPAPPLETPHTSRQLNAHHRPQRELHTGATPPARTVTSEQPHTTTTPNGALPWTPAHHPTPAAARAPSTSITRPPCHEAAPQHVNTHDDPMAPDIDSLLELQLQHTEDTEHHMDLTPLELEPAASDPADPSPHNAPPRPPPPRAGALDGPVQRPAAPPPQPQSQQRALKVPSVPRARPARRHGAGTPRVHHRPPPPQGTPHKNGRMSTPSTSPT